MARIIGLLISGASVRIFSICVALYVGHLGYSVLSNSLAHVSTALNAVQ